MNTITRELKINLKPETTYTNFVNQIREWWPMEYTWSQDKLETFTIDEKVDGLCTETGPFGFRCDWGRVTEVNPGKSISFTWQISPKREPVPDPEQASLVKVGVTDSGNGECTLKFSHENFENHGKDADEYQAAMDSEQGWNYILQCFKKFCEKP